MTARKAEDKTAGKKKFVLGARPPQRLSKEDRELLLNLKPSSKMQKLLAKMPPLKIVDGATCGF
jgi:hypothetical protein